VGEQGERLVKLFYESKREEKKSIYIVRQAEPWEQQQGADFFVVNNELGTKYFEVKTDTQAKETGNVALEIQIVDNDGFKSIGCAMKTFPDYLFYWIYPTTEILYYDPKKINPWIIDWIAAGNHRIVEAENKNFFSRSLLIPISELKATGEVHTLNVSEELVDKAIYA
jgi:hypothetical protein